MRCPDCEDALTILDECSTAALATVCAAAIHRCDACPLTAEECESLDAEEEE